jgi:hypothetical protein
MVRTRPAGGRAADEPGALRCYETEWMMLHKLRRAMVNPERPSLVGPVEDSRTPDVHDTGVAPAVLGRGP